MLSNTQKGSKIKNTGSNIGIKWCRDRWWEKWIKNGWTVAGKWCIFSKITFISLHCCSDSLSTANITTYTMENTSQSRWHRRVPRLGHISFMSLQYQQSPQDILAPATGYAGQFSVQTNTQHLANLYSIYKEGGIHISLQRKKITLVYIIYQNT